MPTGADEALRLREKRPKPEALTIGGLIDQFRATSGDRVRAEDARHAEWWKTRLGRTPVTELTTGLIVSQLERLAAYNRRPSTVNFYLRFFRRVCAWGALLGYLPADPCAEITFHKEPTPTVRVLTETEEARLCSMLGPPYSLWVKLAIETGLKQSEQFTLRWRDVNLDRATVLLPHASTGAVTACTLSPTAVAILRQLRHQQPPSLWVFPDPKNPFRAVNIHAFYVGRWVSAVQRADIPWCAWKDLRHTCGARLAAKGLSTDAIVTALRHRENRRVYVYRAVVANRPQSPRATQAPRQPVFPELMDGELRQVMARDLTANPLTFGEAARLYAVHHLRDRPARGNFDRIYRQFWQGWADRSLASLTRKEIRAWYLELGHIPGHANKSLTLLRSLYNWLAEMELTTVANPANGIRRFPSASRDRFLSLDELQRVMEGLPHLTLRARAYFSVLLFTGARLSEARLMKWQDIDLQTRVWKKSRTKNGTTHYVPLPMQVLEALHALPRVTDWVFSGRQGKPISASGVEKHWGVIRRRWGLDDVRIHDLRRTCASHLAIGGENLPTIQNVLNHRSLVPTSIYARLNTSAMDRALQAQADRFCALAPGLPLLPMPLTEGPPTTSPVEIVEEPVGSIPQTPAV